MIFPKVYWNDDAQPDGLTLDRVLYQVRFTDGMAGLLLDAVCIADILEDSDGEIALDALVSPFARLPRKMELLRVAMERVGATVKPSAVQITEPFKQRGVANVAAVFELSDGQTVSIFFHNPDVTPNKMAATDEVISWKWLLNKKDVTIVVAPERGVDLNVREVARRMMRLAEKNSAAFMRANVKRGDRMAALEGLRSEIVTLTKELDTAKETLATLQDAAQTSAAQRAPNSGGRGANETAESLIPGLSTFGGSNTYSFKLWMQEAGGGSGSHHIDGSIKADSKDQAESIIVNAMTKDGAARMLRLELSEIGNSDHGTTSAGVTKAQHNQAQARSRSEAEAAFFVAKKFASTEAKYNAHIDNGDVVGTAGDYAILHMAGDDRVPEHFRLESPESAISAFRTKEDAVAWVAANTEPEPDSGNAEAQVAIGSDAGSAREWRKPENVDSDPETLEPIVIPNADDSVRGLIDSYVAAFATEAASMRAAIAAINWGSIVDSESAVAAVNALRMANPRDGSPIIAAANALNEAGIETWDARLSYVQSSDEFKEHGLAMDARTAAEDQIQAHLKDYTKKEGAKDLAEITDDTPPEDVARAVFRSRGIEVSRRSDWIKELVWFIESKNADALRGRLAGVGSDSNGASMEVFTRMTGIKLAKTQKERARQIDAWAGITQEQRAKINENRRAENAKKDLNDAVVRAWKQLALQDVNASGMGIVTMQAFVLAKITAGYSNAVTYKSGAANSYRLSNDDGMSVFVKSPVFSKFLKAAIAAGGISAALAIVGVDVPVAAKSQPDVQEASEDDLAHLFGKGAAGGSDDADMVAAVDSAYLFANATNDFKLWMHESLTKESYSPFVTAKAMDEAAKRNGATIEWGEFGGAKLDSIALDWVKERALYQAAIDADEDFQRELERVFGKGKANSMRMQKKYDDPKLEAARKKKLALEESLRKAWQAGEVVDNAFNINISNENEDMKSTITFDSSNADQIEHAMKLLGMHKAALDSAGDADDDFDEEQEWEDMPDDDDALDSVALDGDFPGHPFRGNQHRKVSRKSGSAVSASVGAKKAERGGDKRAIAKAHKSAYHAHAAAAEDDSLPKATTKYHKKMASFHKRKAGV